MTPLLLFLSLAFALLVVMLGLLVGLVLSVICREIAYRWRCWRGSADDDQWHA